MVRTKGWFDNLMKRFIKHLREKAVNSLLVGNDTNCFTTAQYREAYCQIERGDKTGVLNKPETYDRIIGPDWARMHLEGLSSKVQEVAKDVWAPVNDTKV